MGAGSIGQPRLLPRRTGLVRVYYDQAGKLAFRASVAATTLGYRDSSLSRGVSYCYGVTSFSDCDADGVVDAGEEGAPGNLARATAQ
jgi:hypothetical protein